MNMSLAESAKASIDATAGHFLRQQFLYQRSTHVSDDMLTTLYNELVTVSCGKVPLERTHQLVP
jgi:hypothetical protein